RIETEDLGSRGGRAEWAGDRGRRMEAADRAGWRDGRIDSAHDLVAGNGREDHLLAGDVLLLSDGERGRHDDAARMGGAVDIDVVDLKTVAEAAVGEGGILSLGLVAVMRDGALGLAVAPVADVVVDRAAPRHRRDADHDADLIKDEPLCLFDHL